MNDDDVLVLYSLIECGDRFVVWCSRCFCVWENARDFLIQLVAAAVYEPMAGIPKKRERVVVVNVHRILCAIYFMASQPFNHVPWRPFFFSIYFLSFFLVFGGPRKQCLTASLFHFYPLCLCECAAPRRYLLYAMPRSAFLLLVSDSPPMFNPLFALLFTLELGVVIYWIAVLPLLCSA